MLTNKIDVPMETWRLDRYLHHIDLSLYKVLSLDIFDTLIFRSCEKPEDIFEEVGKRGKNQGALYKGIDEHEFKLLRKLAEQKSRAAKVKEENHSEVNLASIYDQIPKELLDREQMIQLELQVEREYIYLNPSVLSLIYEAKRLGLKVVLTSDMYLTKAQLLNILEHNGLDTSLIDELFVSCEYQGDKASGVLFEAVIRTLQASPSEIVHIGDNFAADVRGAENFGIRAYHYQTIPPQYDSSFELEKIRHSVLLPELLSLRKLAGSLNVKYQAEKQFWYEFGATILGPFYTLFSEWIIGVAEKENIKNIYPFMREGNFLTELIKNTIDDRKLNIEVKPLYVSRLATYFASMDKFQEEEISNYFLERNANLEGLFNALDLKHFRYFEKYYNVLLTNTSDVQYKDTNLKDAVISFLLKDETQEHINKRLQKLRNSLTSYLKQELQARSLTVDLGFKGTIQRSLFNVLSSDIYVVVHLLAIGSNHLLNHKIDGVDIRAFTHSSKKNSEIIRTIMRSQEILEQTIMREDGTTIGYSSESDVVKPIQAENSLDHEEILHKRLIQQGIFKFQQLYFTWRKQNPNLAMQVLNNRDDALKIIHRFIDLPSSEEATNLGQLSHDDNFGKIEYNQICTQEKIDTVTSIGIEKYHHASRYKHTFPNDYWPQGIITQIDPSYLIRKQMNSGHQNSYSNQMMNMVIQANNLELQEVIVYGGGEAGAALIQLMRQFAIKVIAVVDRNSSLWGSFIQGVPVMSLKAAMELNNHCYLVGSFAFAKEIRQDILKAYEGFPNKPLVITLE